MRNFFAREVGKVAIYKEGENTIKYPIEVPRLRKGFGITQILDLGTTGAIGDAEVE